jgi:cytochrome b pre-mRNA-processing protein 3
MFLSAFRKDPRLDAAEALYLAAAGQALRPEFYASGGVPDSFEGRFELAALHLWLALARLKTAAAARETSQALVDAFFRRLDDALRESGVGDLSVGRRIRKLAEAFYGRARAYDAALAPEAPADGLAAALARNVFSSSDPATGAALAVYVRRAAAALSATSDQQLLAGGATFPEPLGGDAHDLA